MVIDVHRHMVMQGTVHGDYIRGASKSFSMKYGRSHNLEIGPREFIEKVVRPLTDPTGDSIIREMDEAGCDKTIIFTVDYGLLFGETPMNIFDQNKKYAEVARRHEGRLLSFIAIDPRRKGALAHCRQAYEEWGMKGFKLHAGVGYMPDDPVCYWVYELAAEWKIPIMCHTGGAPSVALRWENSRPSYFASAAARYPEVDFILAHAGDIGWWGEAAQAAAWMRNIYLDLSLWQKPFKKQPAAQFYGWLRQMIDLCGADKLMFATDAPFPNLFVPLKDWVKVFREPKTDIQFTAQEMERILGGTAKKVLGL